jgi:hypothetical protein
MQRTSLRTKIRSPVCLNPPAARFNVPLTLKRTDLILAGRSKSQMFADMSAALDKKELPALEPGAMCYMLSRQGYLSDRAGHWHPRLMFFIPLTDPASWGTGLPGSPVVGAFSDTPERHTFFLIPSPSGRTVRPLRWMVAASKGGSELVTSGLAALTKTPCGSWTAFSRITGVS